MRKDYYSNSKDYINRWVVSYADFVTMLLALFLVMYAVSQNVTKCQAKIIEKNNEIIAQNSELTSGKSLNKLEEIFSEHLKDNQSVKLVKEPQGLIVRLNNNILFDEGSAIIKTEAYETIDNIIAVIEKIDNRVVIEGHTDSTPIKTSKYPSNWELSTSRATNIISYIMKTGKVSPNRLSAMGFGEYMPIADNTSSDGRMLNRRVDIIILDK